MDWVPGQDRCGASVVRIGFGRRTCLACPTRAPCTQANTALGEMTLRQPGRHEAIQAARERQDAPAWRAPYGARAGIEGCLLHGVRVRGMRRARHVGLTTAHPRHVATAATLNIVRLSAWVQGKTSSHTNLAPGPPRSRLNQAAHEFANGIGSIPADMLAWADQSDQSRQMTASDGSAAGAISPSARTTPGADASLDRPMDSYVSSVATDQPRASASAMRALLSSGHFTWTQCTSPGETIPAFRIAWRTAAAVSSTCTKRPTSSGRNGRVAAMPTARFGLLPAAGTGIGLEHQPVRREPALRAAGHDEGDRAGDLLGRPP